MRRKWLGTESKLGSLGTRKRANPGIREETSQTRRNTFKHSLRKRIEEGPVPPSHPPRSRGKPKVTQNENQKIVGGRLTTKSLKNRMDNGQGASRKSGDPKLEANPQKRDEAGQREQ